MAWLELLGRIEKGLWAELGIGVSRGNEALCVWSITAKWLKPLS